jgi:DeoR/GlpR family transcriptional regulator of sugar metabolism
MRSVLDMLTARESISVSELSTEFLVSEVTIRSDLAQLAREGLVARTRGGVRALQPRQTEAAFEVRLRVQALAKQSIARAAAELVRDGDAVALDSSTTAYYLGLQLRHRKELVVVTNGLYAARALADAPGVQVLVTGGILRLPAVSLVGDVALSVLKSANITMGFFGTRGLSLDHGLTDLSPDEVEFKRRLASACQRVVCVADATKWSRTALLSFAQPEEVDIIVTDPDAPSAVVDTWLSRDVEVVVASLDAAANAEPSHLLEPFGSQPA